MARYTVIAHVVAHDVEAEGIADAMIIAGETIRNQGIGNDPTKFTIQEMKASVTETETRPHVGAPDQMCWCGVVHHREDDDRSAW